MKKIFLCFYVFCLILLISSVSAADLNSTDDSIGADVDDTGGYVNVSGTFSELRTAVNAADKINLTGDITNVDENVQIVISSGKNITINGNGHVINANKLGRIFYIDIGGELNLINAKLTGGYLSPYLPSFFDGGAIYNMGKLTVTDCEFYDNFAHDGGAIACGDSALTILTGENTFYDNRAWQDGGAIANLGGSKLYITGKNIFDSNQAYYTGSTYIKTDEGKGGAIINAFASAANSKQKAYLYIEGETIFRNNVVNADGGAIFNHQAIANITGKNTFYNNKGVYYHSKGGAINNENGTLYLSGTNKFESNQAYRGGAIDNNLFDTSMTIDGKNQFINNKANMGGAISNQEGIRLNLYGENTFTNNKADFGDGANIGGAIYSYKSLLNINGKNTFTQNSAVSPGGAIYFANSRFSMKGSNTFNSNTAPLGGAILLIDSTYVELLGENVFNSNSASSSGGAIRANNVYELVLGNHNYFINNKASHSGGAVYTQNSFLNSQGSLYEGNTALYGGAIFIENSRFTGNYNIFKNNVGSKTGSDVESFQSSINSLEYNYWNSQNKVSQNNIHNYAVSNIRNWVILDLTIPSEIKQFTDTEIVRFKNNNYGNLNGEMPNYTVSVTPNFNPSNVVVNKNVGKSKYMGGVGQTTISVDSSNFIAMKKVNVVEGKVQTILIGNNILLNDSSQKANYEVTLSDANGKKLSGKTIEITVGGIKYIRTTDNQGKATLILSYLGNGYHEIVSTFAGESTLYDSKTTNAIICLFNNESDVSLTGKDFEMYYKDGSRYEVKLTDANNKALANKDIKFYINGQIYTRTTNSDGVASIAVNLNAGTINVMAIYPDDFTYVENTITIKSTISGKDVVKYFRNGTQYYAKFLDSKGNVLKNTDVKYNINGVFYTRTTDSNGYARMNINLNPGTYIITATNPVNGEMHSNKITVRGILEGNDLTKYYRNDSQYYIKVLDDQGNPVGKGVEVSFNINGVFYKRTTDESGYARMNVNLIPGDYIITAEYKNFRYSNNIKVLPILSAKDITMNYRDGTKFKAKLVDGQGKAFVNKTVTFNVNGVFYNRTTDDSGFANLSINLMPGEYIITSMYETARISNKITIRS